MCHLAHIFTFPFQLGLSCGKLFTESMLPGFACRQLKIFVLCQILDKVAVAVLAPTLFLVTTVFFAFVSCGGMIGFLFIGLICNLLERCRQVHLEGAVEHLFE